MNLCIAPKTNALPSKLAWLVVVLTGALVAPVFGQSDSLHVLFLGNSYTYGNALPSSVQFLGKHDSLILTTDSVLPGGHTLNQHSRGNAASMAHIQQGGWDWVVLQEQSQIPTIPFYRDNEMFPAGARLADSIRAHSECVRILSFMTWGRRFGGQQCGPGGTPCSPVFTDFDHMTDSLQAAYTTMSMANDLYISPVGVAWKAVLNDTNLVLHTADNSHPNATGSYLAACVLYSSITGLPTSGNPYHATLSAQLAGYLQAKSDSVVFNATEDWNRNHEPQVEADFSFVQDGSTFITVFTDESSGAQEWSWDFGDGTTSTDRDPTHTYASIDSFTVRLIVRNCWSADTSEQTLAIIPSDSDTTISRAAPALVGYRIFPNPASTVLHIEAASATSAQTSLRLLNPQGQILREEQIGTTHQLNVGDLPRGIYLLEIRSETGTHRQRILLE